MVIDYKTGKSRYPDKDLAEHPQLAAYQVAVTEGGFTDGEPAESGGAQLIQLGTANRGEGHQPGPAAACPRPPIRTGCSERWPRSPRRCGAIRCQARPGKSCDRCPVREQLPGPGRRPAGDAVTAATVRRR